MSLDCAYTQTNITSVLPIHHRSPNYTLLLPLYSNLWYDGDYRSRRNGANDGTRITICYRRIRSLWACIDPCHCQADVHNTSSSGNCTLFWWTLLCLLTVSILKTTAFKVSFCHSAELMLGNRFIMYCTLDLDLKGIVESKAIAV